MTRKPKRVSFILLWTKLHTLFGFMFFPNFLFLVQVLNQDTTLNLVTRSFQPCLVCDSLSDFSCFQWSWQFWGELVRCFIDILPSVFVCSFSWLDWYYKFLRKWPEVKCHSYLVILKVHVLNSNIKGTCSRHHFSLMMLTSIAWPR